MSDFTIDAALFEMLVAAVVMFSVFLISRDKDDE
jgi:hypothetical protein